MWNAAGHLSRSVGFMFVHGHSTDSGAPSGPLAAAVVEGNWAFVEAVVMELLDEDGCRMGRLRGKGREGVRRTPGSWWRVFVVGSIQISFTTVKDGRGEGLLLGPPTVVESGVARTWHLGRRSVPLLLVLLGWEEKGSEEEESLVSAEAGVRERRVAWESLGDCLIWGTTKGGATRESEEREPIFLKTGDGQSEVGVVEAEVADPLVSDRWRVIVEDEDEDVVVVERWSSSRGVEGGGVGLEDVKGVKKSMRELRRLVPDPVLVLLSR